MAINKHSESIIIVDLPAEPDIRAELDALMNLLAAGNSSDVIIDFSQVDIMTSMSLSGCLKVRELIAEAHQRLIFTNTAAITKDIFKVTCFDGIFEFIDDRDKAIQTLKEARQTQNAV